MRHNQASSTALLIAKSLVFSAENPKIAPFISREAAEIYFAFLRTEIGRRASVYKFLGKVPLARWVVRQIERLSVPGMILHYILRKKEIERLIETAATTAGGVKQLVILGAGADTLGLRMAAKYAGLRVFEIDHPATQSVKQRMLSLGYVKKPENFCLIPADLSKTDAKQVLRAEKSFSFASRTIFLAEGVFMYLSTSAVADTLSVMQCFPTDHAHFVFTYMMLDRNNRPAFTSQTTIVDQWLRKKREPFLWGFSPKDMSAFLTKLGYTAGPHYDAKELHKLYLADSPLAKFMNAEGENITSAKW